MTYDREVLKLDAERVAIATQKLYETPPVIETVLATSQQTSQTWRYTTTEPAENWHEPDFDDSAWKTGLGGFGYYDLPTYPLKIIDPGTQWNTDDIWIRRSFDLDNTSFRDPYFLVFNNDEAELYVNGELVLNLPRSAQFYEWIPMDETIMKKLKKKDNSIAVHTHDDHHPKFIDVGIVDVLPAGRAAERVPAERTIVIEKP